MLGQAELHAADIDPAAVRCAGRNLAARGGRVYEGDLYQPLPSRLRGRIDILIANVPYVPTDAVRTLPPEARLHEARLALDGGPDGLDTLRRVAAEASLWLAPGGHLLAETSERQALRAAEAFAVGGLAARVASSADQHATVIIGTRPAGRVRQDRRPAGRPSRRPRFAATQTWPARAGRRSPRSPAPAAAACAAGSRRGRTGPQAQLRDPGGRAFGNSVIRGAGA